MKLTENIPFDESTTWFPVFERGKYSTYQITLGHMYDLIKGMVGGIDHKWHLYKTGVITKRSLPSIIIGGTCKAQKRCLVDNMKPTGLMVFDVDMFEFNVKKVKKEFANCNDENFDPIMCFISPSGKGLKMILYPKYIYRGNFGETHKVYAKHLIDKYGWAVAQKGQSNINRKTYLALDTKVFYSLNKKTKAYLN